MSDLLGVLRVRSLLANGELESFAESAALFASVGVLLGDNDESRQIVLNGFLSGVGECEGVSCMYIKGSFCCSNPDFFSFQIHIYWKPPNYSLIPLAQLLLSKKKLSKSNKKRRPLRLLRNQMLRLLLAFLSFQHLEASTLCRLANLRLHLSRKEQNG